MGTVKYSGPVASFHCPTEATIRSLKVHFSPKQLGEGTPSPENVREIVGWDGVELQQTQKNLWGNKFAADEIYTEYKKLFPTGNKVRYEEDNNGKYLCIESAYKFDTTNIAPSFKPKTNTVYTIIFSGELLSSSLLSSNITIHYTDGTYQYPYFTKNSEKELVVFKTAIGKTIDYIGCRFLYNTTKIYYEDKFGIFEGDIDISEYEPYHGSTTNYEFGVLGKNKLSDNLTDYTLINSPADTILSNGSYSGTVNEGQRDVGICKLNNKYPAGTYTLSFDYVNNVGNTLWRPVLISKYNDSSWYSALISTNPAAESSGHYTKTFTTDEDFYVHLTLNCFAAASVTAINSISNLQLELSSSATTYESYDPNKTVYGGWVDLITGEVCEEWHKMVIDTTSHIGLFPWGGVKTDATTETEYATALFRRESTDPKAYTIKDNLCDKLPISIYLDKINTAYVYDGDTYGPAISLPTSVIGTTNETLTEYLTDNPFTFVYKQRVPNTYQLAPTQLQTFLSHNNIWSNADYVEVEYDLHETQTILARKQFIIANQPHVVKPAAAPLQNFVTDMAAPVKSCKVHFSPVQDTSNGAPSPDNICPISGWTGLEVTRCGKNFSTAATGTEMAQKWPVNSGSSRELLFSGMQPGQEFTLSASFTKASEPNSNKRLYLIGSQKANSTSNEIFQSPSADGPRDVVIHNWVDTDGTIKITHNNRGLTYNDDFIEYAASLQNIQLELGDTTTAFESYNGTTIPITFPSEAGTIYGGYVDLVTGEVWKTWDILTATNDNGTFVSYDDLGDDWYHIVVNFASTKRANGWNAQGICNILEHSIKSAQHDQFYFYYVLNGAAWKVELVIHTDNSISDIQGLVDVLEERNFMLAYELYAPEFVTTLTPTQLKTLRGTNNIWASNNGGNIEVSFWRH